MSDRMTLEHVEDSYKNFCPGSWDYELESGSDGPFYKLYNEEGKFGEVYEQRHVHGIWFMYHVFPQLIERIRELESENAELKNQLRDALERC